MNHRIRPTAPAASTSSRGIQLERQVREILKLFPGAAVESETRLLGKKVDAVCTIPGNIIPTFRIAVECKDWHKSLTRQQCVNIIAEYRDIIDRKEADQLMLVTSNDIVPNARDLFDGSKFRHLTIDQLGDKVFDPSPLVENMRNLFLKDSLNEYYVPARAVAPDIGFHARHYDLLYNDFMDLACEGQIIGYESSLRDAKRQWKRYGKGPLPGYVRRYSDEFYGTCLNARRSLSAVDLESAVVAWAKDDSMVQIALLGSYGTGKSTFARRIASRLAEDYRKGISRRIPFLIELKEFGVHQDIGGLITHELVNKHRVANGSFESFQAFNRSGRLILILDGFDEMKQGLTVDSLLYNFNQIFSVHEGSSKVLLCGRPTLFEDESEQNRILSGRAFSSISSSARYISTQIAPPNEEEVYSILLGFSAAKAPSTLPQVQEFVARLRTMTKRGKNNQLKDLVSRPVHLPMLVSIMQRRAVDPEKLNRATLYREFIDAMIERETLKRHAQHLDSYSAQVRRQFAQDLALEMWARGEHRSIRASEIPLYLVEPYCGPGRPLDAVRRDLIASGFFERKAPDILFVPHKSFLEYLVAERIYRSMFHGRIGDSAYEGIDFSEEIRGFLLDMMTPSDWVLALSNWAKFRSFLRNWSKAIQFGGVRVSGEAEAALAENLVLLPESMLAALLSYYQTQPKWRSEARQKIIAFGLASVSDYVAIHAYRALMRGGSTVGESIFKQVGPERMLRWYALKWIGPFASAAKPSDLEPIERSHYVSAGITPSPHLRPAVRWHLLSLIRRRTLSLEKRGR